MITRKTKTRSEFDAHLADLHIRGQWRVDELLNTEAADGPRPMGVPYLWKWATVRNALAEACEVLTESLTQRRSLIFMNPELKAGTTHTFGVGIQLVMPGELAWAHRHTMAAIRFGIEGDQRLSTVVDGCRLPMEPGDLILTPSLSWHDHHNESDRDGIWLDAIDAPMMGVLGQRWYQPYGESLQPRDPQQSDPGYRYAWHDIREQLRQIAPASESPYDGALVKYVNPRTAGPTLPTLGCAVQSLRPGLRTAEHRHTSSVVYFVVKGEGATYAGDRELRWAERDTFVVPNWTRHWHVNASAGDAILFSVTDEPLLRAIGLYREDPEHERNVSQ